MPPEPWGGDVHAPRWLRRLMHRPEPPADTPEAAHEKRKSQGGPSVLENANRAVSGAVVDIYNESRRKASPRGDRR
jgi:hypothetical protein